ncbi:MAG: ATP-binding cassette domain-containing protein, partial [Tannerella sp.]|nr:ATP-binding cassette domain-containing protein [Tannerella sp.]
MLIALSHAQARLPERQFRFPVDWRIEEGQQWAIIGPNGAGKTLLAELLQ